MLTRTRLRLRLQLVAERATTMAVVAGGLLIVALFFYKSRSLDLNGLLWVVGALGVVTLAGGAWGLLAPLGDSFVLKRLDVTNATRDAMGSALDFARRLPGEPEGVQRQLMEAHIREALSLANRIDHRRASRFRRPRDLPALGVVGLALVAFGTMALPVDATRASIPPPAKPATPIRIDADLYQEAVDNMKDIEDTARHLKDRAMLDFLEEYRKLLDALKKGALTREEFEQRYQALLKKYFMGLDQQQANLKSMRQQLHDVGKALEKDPLSKKLGEALKKHDLDAARQELKRLAEKLEKGKINPYQRKRLAKAMEQAAKALQNKDAKQLEQRIRKHEEALGQKQKDAEARMRKLQRKLDKTRDPQKRQALKRQFNKERRRLERLRRRQKQLERQRRTLKRLSRSMENVANQLKRQKMDAKTRAALQKLMRELSKYQNQSARGGARGQARLTMKQLKELLKRLRSQRGRRKGQLSDYLNRARRGNKGHGKSCPSCGGSGKKKGGKGPCPSCGGGGRVGGVTLRPGSGSGKRQGGLRRGGDKPGGQKGGKGGKKWGNAHNPETVKGRPTALDAKHREHKAKGKQGEGPSEAEVFQGGADKGFSSQNYRRVYVQYKKIWQKVLDQEEIPPGYRYLIERYFRLVKPR